MEGATLELKDVRKRFTSKRGSTDALYGLDLKIEKGEFLCILGPSGCGKSTILNLIAGLEKPESGDILEDGSPITGPSPDRMLMFQDSALFPWLDVLGNVAFGLRKSGMDRAKREGVAKRYIEMVGLARFERHYVHELSGGMRQRVALARALAPEPRVLLMDEPFAALDAQTRDGLHEEVQAIWRFARTTIVFVTHNVREALILGDRTTLMSARPGKILREFRFDIPRPRHFEDPGIAEAARSVLADLRAEVRRAAEEGAA